MPQPNDGRDGTDGWLREQIAEILQHGWTLDELESVGITRALLTRLGFRDDHPALFEEPPPLRPPRPDPGGPRPQRATEAASPTRRDAASAFGVCWRPSPPIVPRRLKPRLEQRKVRLRGLAPKCRNASPIYRASRGSRRGIHPPFLWYPVVR